MPGAKILNKAGRHEQVTCLSEPCMADMCVPSAECGCEEMNCTASAGSIGSPPIG